MITLQQTKNASPPRMLIHGGEKVGKALDISTIIPTPSGWKMLKDIQMGDHVFDKDGVITKVTNITTVMNDRECYELKFKDGSTIIADGDHQWEVINLKHKTSVKTTKEILANIQPKKKDRFNFSVPISGPLKTSEIELPIDPYTLGVWLGDGTNATNQITIYDRDRSIVESLNVGDSRNPRNSCQNYTLIGLKPIMKELDLFHNKHIPKMYFRSSYMQRIELLRGLMDTDGYISDNGKATCEFVSIDKKLAEDFLHLIRTLGIKSKIITGDATLEGRYICKKYRVYFFPNFNPFSVKFKSDRYEEKTSKRKTNKNAIISITKVQSVPVKCIEVASESHTYLAGPAYTVTHNSTFASQCPNPIFLPTEEGLKGISTRALVSEGKARLETYEEFDQALAWAEANLKEFDSVVIDSADWLETLIHEKITRDYSKKSIEEAAGGYGKGYTEAFNKWSNVLMRLDRINKAGKWIVVICHSKSVLVNDPTCEPYDEWTLKLHSPKKQNGSLELLKEWADIIAFALVEKFVSETNTTKPDESKVTNRAITTGNRKLFLEANQAYLAGNRYGMKESCELTWNDFMSKFMEAQNNK